MAEPARVSSVGCQPVPDWETSCVTLVLPTAAMYAYNRDLAALELFYAELCRTLAEAETVACVVPDPASVEKMVRLSGLPAACFPVGELPDLWVRDFAPIPTLSGPVKFRYDPLYTSSKLNRKVDEGFRRYLRRRDVSFRSVDLALEGGNLTHNGDGVAVVTEKLFARNRPSTREQVVEALREALGLERVVVLPAEPGDRTGHIDGMLRFVGERSFVVNVYPHLGAGSRFRRRLERILAEELSDFERIELPYHASPEKIDGWYDARGNYANFLRTRSRVYLPVYGIPEDEQALGVFESLVPGRVTPVDASLVARYGGALHCISWNRP